MCRRPYEALILNKYGETETLVRKEAWKPHKAVDLIERRESDALAPKYVQWTHKKVIVN